jgi:DNA-binding Lrp family transcriptional regulator
VRRLSIEEPVKLDKLDKELLQVLQDEFPVEGRPWAEIGKKLGISGEEALSRSQRLHSDGVIRKLRTILNAQKLGHCQSTLMAMKVPEEQMEKVVSIVNEYMSVTHNYQREHDFNLWFTVTTCGDVHLSSTVEEIKRRTEIPESDILDLPTTRLFKIDVRFKFTDSDGKGIPTETTVNMSSNTNVTINKNTLDEIDRAVLHITQDGIPLVNEPFASIAKETGISQKEVVAVVKKLIDSGVIKRLGISVNQRKVGIVANAVVAWKVPQDQVERVGSMVSSYKEITHCYERITIPGKWEHNLFTVLHGYDRRSVEEFAENMSKAIGIRDYLVLFSNEQFKRTSVMQPLTGQTIGI